MYKLLPVPKRVAIDEKPRSVFEDIVISFRDCPADLTEDINKIINFTNGSLYSFGTFDVIIE